MVFETLCLAPAGLERQTGWSVGPREDVCEEERGVPLPEDGE